MLTVLGGKPVYGAAELRPLRRRRPPAMPDWSPVRSLRRLPQDRAGGAPARVAACGCGAGCAVHGHDHAAAGAAIPALDLKSFWGALGCSCWAV